jgi:hypothetical protein
MQLTRLATAALLALWPCVMAPKSASVTAALNFCHGFAQGAVSVEMEMQAAERRQKLFCFPTPAPTRTATIAEFVTWARADPAHLTEPAADGLFRFLRGRFPCGK